MRKFGSLSALDSFRDENAPWAVVFHGFGADAYDLFPLHDVIVPKKPLNWILPQGPLEVPVGPMWNGRAWWNIDIEKIQRDAASSTDRDLSTEAPPEMNQTRNQMLKAIETMKVPWNKIILCGFSQGAMLATDIFLQAPENPLGLVLWSGALVNKQDWKTRTQSEEFKKRDLKGFPFFQSHGSADGVLTLKNGQRLESFLQSLGMKGKNQVFPGVHEIPAAAILGTVEYLNLIL